MVDVLELEGTVDNYLLEDGLGNYALDKLIIIKNTIVGITEVKDTVFTKVINNIVNLTENIVSVNVLLQNIISTISLSELINKIFPPFTARYEKEDGDFYELEDGSGVYIFDYPLKISDEAVGLVEGTVRTGGILKNIADIIGLTEAVNKVSGAVKILTSFIVSVESTINKILTDVNLYLLEDGSGRLEQEAISDLYLLDQKQITENLTSTIGLTEASEKFRGFLKFASSTISITEALNRLQNMVRIPLILVTVGITEASNRTGVWIRNLSSTIGITESNNRLRVMFRNLSSTVGITETSQKLKGFLQIINFTVGVTEAVNKARGFIRIFTQTVGLTESNNKIRIITISFDFGDFIITDGVDLGDSIVVDGLDLEDSFTISSLNIGDMIVNNG